VTSGAHPPKPPLLVSACLLGLHTTFTGADKRHPAVLALGEDHQLVPFCPEQLGGLGTPRPPAEIQGGTGEDVLDGRAPVVTSEGEDVTDAFLRGAREAAATARLVGARRAVLKARSPSCGVGAVYDGSFSRRLRPGSGVAATLLVREGLEVVTEEDLALAAGAQAADL
jgi:uncharacterized protein YbbK (DUF523 family)